MPAPIVTLRSVKGAALTHTEMDNNFTNLQSPNVTARVGTTTGYFSTAFDFTIANNTGIGASISGNTITLHNTAASAAALTFSNTATLTLTNVSSNISGTVASTTFAAGAGSAAIAPGGTLSIANSATVQGSIAGTTLTLQSNISASSLGALTGIAITAGGTTTTGATGVTIANTATVGGSLSGNTLSLTYSGISLIAGGTTTTGVNGITIANTATIGASLSSNTLSITPVTVGTAGTYQGAVTTDVYGRVTAGSNSLSGNLDANQNWIGNVQLNNATLGTYIERVANIGASLSGNLTINANTAPIQTGACSGNISIFSGNLTNFLPGESVTLVLTHTANTRTLSSNLQFVNGTKTIGGTTNVTDVITIFCAQTSPTPVYLATVAKFQL